MEHRQAPEQPRSRDRLLDATLRSIHVHGFTQTTVTTVTELAGVSRGMVRHEFGSKHAMVIAALDRLCGQWLAATEPDPQLSGRDQVGSIVAAMFAPEAFTPIAVDAWLALSVEARSDPELHRLRVRTHERWVEQLTTAYTQTGVEHPEQCAVATLATADGLWLRHRGADTDPDSAGATELGLRVVEGLLADVDC
ncbi:MAG: TetR family transcriptional regulator C-terminal domain-containing protein [Actinomycetota bacterium]